jgi:hypothetical protein
VKLVEKSSIPDKAGGSVETELLKAREIGKVVCTTKLPAQGMLLRARALSLSLSLSLEIYSEEQT